MAKSQIANGKMSPAALWSLSLGICLGLVFWDLGFPGWTVLLVAHKPACRLPYGSEGRQAHGQDARATAFFAISGLVQLQVTLEGSQTG